MLATIRATQPHGPYVLAGFSLGGLIVYEIASQLQLSGESVARIWILDSVYGPAVYQREIWPYSPRGVGTRLYQIGPWAAAKAAGRIVRRMLRGPLVHLLFRGSSSDDFDYRGALVLGSKYTSNGHEVPMELFASADSADAVGGPTLGWEKVHRGPITVHMIPGKHSSMLIEPTVRIVAEILTDSLRSTLAALDQGSS
jgi:thioesterase domain-containing protein